MALNLTNVDRQWLAVYVRSNCEQVCARVLREKGYETFVPTTAVNTGRTASGGRQRDAPLFPGYVFCRFDSHARWHILDTPGVIRVVTCGLCYAIVSESEIDAVRRVPRTGCRSTPVGIRWWENQ